jgi:nucleoside-diphosphate-sugar epimerase
MSVSRIEPRNHMPVLITGGAGFIGTNLAHRLLCAEDHLPQIAGQAFNIGGGPDNTMRLIELVERITVLNGSPLVVPYGPWRIGDQRWYVSNPDKLERATGWRPKTTVENGCDRYMSAPRSIVGRPPAARVTGT